MRIHFIGHASILIETQDKTILMDPVFSDPQHEGLCAMSPERVVNMERLPDYDLIVLSHRHLDHFHIRTLSLLNRNCPVIIPSGDNALAYAFRKLGFRQVRAFPHYHKLSLGQTQLVFTPSAVEWAEFGLIVRDSSGAMWNQVDTAIRPGNIRALISKFGSIDFLIAKWQPLLEVEVLRNEAISFPYETYFRELSHIKMVNPRALVPGSCMFKYIGESTWLNKFAFPVSREQFLRDVAKILPRTKAMAVNPGDVVELTEDDISVKTGESAFVKMVNDDSPETTYDPTGEIPELRDLNPNEYSEHEMLQTITDFLRDRLLPAFESSIAKRGLVCEYASLEAVYQLDVVFPSTVRSWWVNFGESPLRINEGSPQVTHVNSRITASVLTDLIQSRRFVDYALGGGNYRYFLRLYLLSPQGFFKWKPMYQGSAGDPIWAALPHEDLFMKYIDREIEAVNMKKEELLAIAAS